MKFKTIKLIKTADSKSLLKWKLTWYEYMWKSLFVCVVIYGSFLVQKIIQFHNSEETNHIQKGKITDFWISCVVACIIAIIRYLIKYFLLEQIIPLLSEKRCRTPEEGRKRADQICKWIYDWFYYSGTTIAAYLILKDQKFFPRYLGGPEDGDCNLLFMGFPEVPDISYLRTFYLIQYGTHLFTFVHQLYCKMNDPKYFEYVLHHGLALFLLTFSYLMNMILVGTVVLFLHDPSDVTLITARVYTDYKHRKKPVTIILGIIGLVNWIFLRNIVFPTCVIRSCFNFYMSFKNEMLADIVQGPILYQTGMLSVLAIMHIYWIIFMVKGALQLLRYKDKNGYDS